MWHHATKKELNNATGLHESNFAAKVDFIAFKTEVDKVDVKKSVNVPTSLSNSKTKLNDLNVGKLKTASINFKKLSVASEEKLKPQNL